MKIKTIAVTDHDTQSGCTRAAVLGKSQDVEVIAGLEISAYDYKNNKKVHLLCYAPHFPNRLEGICKQNLDRRRDNHKKAIIEIQKRFPINYDMIAKRAQGSTCIYKQHIMHAIMDCGCADKVYGRAFDMCFGENGLHNEKIEYPDVYEVLSLINSSLGLSVLAHPYLYGNEDIIEDLIKEGLNGIEVWHPSHTEENIAALTEIADKNGLIKTGGSDFHGIYGSRIHTIGKCLTPDSEVEKIIAHKNKKVAQHND